MVTVKTDRLQLEEMWHELRGRVQDRWDRLTAEDLDTVKGQREQLIDKVQEAYDLAREEAEEQVRDFVANLDVDQFDVEHDFSDVRDDQTSTNWLVIVAGLIVGVIIILLLQQQLRQS